MAGLAAGADDFFTKPVEFVELRTRLAALLRVKMLLGQLERAEAVITTLALTIVSNAQKTGGNAVFIDAEHGPLETSEVLGILTAVNRRATAHDQRAATRGEGERQAANDDGEQSHQTAENDA